MSELDKDDASHWKWGFIYYNPHDNKLIVPKRYGWGYTFNFAHKGSWLFILAVLAIIIGAKYLRAV